MTTDCYPPDQPALLTLATMERDWHTVQQCTWCRMQPHGRAAAEVDPARIETAPGEKLSG
eukprot:357839-Chlamydomonas_euryale.AAC.8